MRLPHHLAEELAQQICNASAGRIQATAEMLHDLVVVFDAFMRAGATPTEFRALVRGMAVKREERIAEELKAGQS